MTLKKKNIFKKNGDRNALLAKTGRRSDFQAASRKPYKDPNTATDKYYSIFNSIDEGFCIYELIYDQYGKPIDLRWIEVNPAYERQTGLKDITGKTHRELSLGTSDSWFEMYDRVVKTGEPVQFEKWHPHTQHWYHVHSSRVGDAQSRQVTCMFTDITERKMREQRQAFLNEISKDLLEFHKFSDVEGMLAEKIGRYFNAKWCTFTERDAEDENYIVTGWNADDVKSIRGKHLIRNYLSKEQMRRDNLGEPTIVSDTQKDPRVNAATYAGMGMGSYILIPLSTSGVCKFRLVIATNTTRTWRPGEIELAHELANRIWPRIQRAKSEEALRQSNEVVRLAVEASDIYWWKIDFATNQIEYSSNTEKVIGTTPGQSFEEGLTLIHPDDRETLSGIFKQAIEKHENHVRCQIRSVAIPSDQRWLQVTGTIIRNEEDLPVAAIGVTQNITGRVKREAHLAFLNEVSTELERLTNIHDTMEMLGRKIGAHFGLSHCRFVELDEQNETTIIHHGWQREGMPKIGGPNRIRDFLSPEFNRKMQAGETVVVNDVWNDTLTNGERFAEKGIGSFVMVPFVHDGVWKFWLGLYHSEAYKWRLEEITLMRELAVRIWTRLRRVRAEEDLRRSEEKYRAIFNSINEGFSLLEIVFDEAGQAIDIIIRDANPAQMRIDGVLPSIGKRVSEILPDLELKWIQRYGDIVRTGTSASFEDWSEANQRWYKVHASRVGSEANALVAIVYDDITERKQREEQQLFLLRFSDMLRAETKEDAIINRSLQMLFDHLRLDRCYNGIFQLEEDRGEMNHQVGNDRVFPLPANVQLSDFPEALRVSFERTIVITDVTTAQDISEVDRRSMSSLGVRAVIASSLRRGQQKPFWSIGAISADARHWTPAEIKLVDEITERTWTAVEKARAELALRISQQQLAKELEDAKLLQDVSNLIIREGDIEKFHDELLQSFINIMHADMASIQILDPEKKELHLTAHKNLHSDAVKFWQHVTPNSTAASGRALAKGERVILSDIEKTVGMSKKDLEAYRMSQVRSVQSTVLYSRAGRFLGVISTHWKDPHHPTERELNLLDVLARQTADVIEKKLADEELKKFNLNLEQQVSERTAELKESQSALEKKNEQLEHTVAQLESFNYIASHDLQEPLRKVRTFAYLLAELKVDHDRLNSLIAGINRSAVRMSDLIESLLTYSRTAKSQDAFQPTNLNEILNDVKTDFEIVIQEKQAEIRNDVLPTINAIPFQMHQLFSNLISNSLKFSVTKPVIEIRSREVYGCEIPIKNDLDPERTFIELTVTDNGIGFDNRHRDKIFQVFQRLHSKSAYSGAGIGLSIVERIVKNHGGHIFARGEKGRGAEFTIYLGI